MIHQIFLLAHDWSKCFKTETNITYLKLGDIQGYHPSNTSQLSNLKSTAISLRLKFNSRRKSVFCLLDERKYLFFIKSFQRTLEKEHPTQKKNNFPFSISHFIFPFPIPHVPLSILPFHSPLPVPFPSPIPQSHSPVPFPSPIPHSPFSLLVTSFFVKGTWYEWKRKELLILMIYSYCWEGQLKLTNSSSLYTVYVPRVDILPVYLQSFLFSSQNNTLS